MQGLVATVGTQLFKLVMRVEHQRRSTKAPRGTRSTRMQAYHEIGNAIHADAEIGRCRIMRNIVGPFNTALAVNLVKALKALPQSGFKGALVHDGGPVKSADECLEGHGMRIKLAPELAQLLIYKPVSFIRQEITRLDTAHLIEPQRALGPDTGKTVGLDEGGQIRAQLRLPSGVRR